MTSVYIVTSGEYSSYRVARVFSTREAAEAYVEPRTRPGLYDDDWQVTEWEVDAEPVGVDRLVFTAGLTVVNGVGNSRGAWVRWDDDDQGEEYGVSVTKIKSGKDEHRHFIRVYADSPEKARKIVDDKLAEIRAHTLGLS